MLRFASVLLAVSLLPIVTALGSAPPLVPEFHTLRYDIELGTRLLTASTVKSGTGSVVACAGVVQVTFTTGTSLALPAVEPSAGPCTDAQPPCDAYLLLAPAVVSCEANPSLCCTPLYLANTATSLTLCLFEAKILLDLNHDGYWDVVQPARTLEVC